MKIIKIAKKSSFQVLEENKIPLTDEERDICLKEKAVWHHGPNGEETPAVWKGKNSKGEIVYVTNTHRAYNTATTLKGAIKRYHDFIKSTASVSEKMVKVAFTPDQNRKKIDGIEKDIKDLKKDIKGIKSDVNKVTKVMNNLNIGQRRFWQQQTVFTSLQRKIERFEKVEQEWKKYKNTIDDKIKKAVEKKTRAQIANNDSWYKEGMSLRGEATVKVIMDGREQEIKVPCNPAIDNTKTVSEQVLMHYPVEKILKVDIKEIKK